MLEITTLPNGVRVAIEDMPFVRSVAIGVFVYNGSRNEAAAVSGCSHFIEHMLFKGTDRRSAQDIAEEMDRVGGQLNAYTGKDYTCYYAKVLDTHTDVALDVLSDMFFNSRFDEEEAAKEKGVVVEEINMVEDTPEDLAHDLLQAGVWKGSPLSKPILGTKKSVKALTGADLKSYFQNNYRPERAVIAVAGNWRRNEALEALSRVFGDNWVPAGDVKTVRKTVYKPTIALKEKDSEQLHLCVGFEGLAADDEETYTLAAINTVLGGGMSSRLFQNLRERRGLVYSVYSYAVSYVEAGLMTIYAGLSPACAHEAIELILNDTYQLARDGVDEDTLYKTKEQLKAGYLLSLESSGSRMSAIGRGAVLLNKVNEPDDIIRKIDAVTIERFNDIARKIFTPQSVSLAAVGKLGGLDFEGTLHGRF